MGILRSLLCGTHKPAPPVQFRAAPQTRGAGHLLQCQCAKPWIVVGLLRQVAPVWAQPSPQCQKACTCYPVLLPFNYLLFFLISAHWLKPPPASLISDCHWVSITLWSPALNGLQKSAFF